MSKWEELKFENAIQDVTKNARKIKKEDYLSIGMYNVIDQGKEYLAGFFNDKNGLYVDIPVIVFGDHTRVLKYVDKPLFIGADGLNAKFVYYYLKSCHIIDTGYNRHFKWLKEFDIPYPPLDIQTKIANALDAANALTEKRKEQIEKLDLLIKSQFIEMFGDPVTNPKGWYEEKLCGLGYLNRGVSKHRPRNDSKLLGGIYPLIQTGDVASAGLYIKDYRDTYTEIGLAQSKLWEKGTLCITIAANIAKTGILVFDACFPDSVVGFLANSNKTNNIFVLYWFKFFQKILENQAPESAQKNINLKILRELEIICPPLSLQTQFADFVEKVEAQKTLLKKSLADMEQNYQSLLQKCFKGETF